MQKKTGNITTGHKTVDGKLKNDYIGTGNVVSHVQFSSFIRAATRTTCNGNDNPPGHLRAYDLKQFGDLPRAVAMAAMDATETDDAILYKFRHQDSAGKVHVHGYVLTRTEDGQHERLGSWVTGATAKSHAVVETLKEFVSNPPGTLVRMRDEIVPNKVADIDKYVARLREEIRDPVTEIVRLIGANPDLGVRTENFSGYREHFNLIAALVEPKTSQHYRFSVAGDETLREAQEVLERLGPGAAEDEPMASSDKVRLALLSILSIAQDADRYGMTDEGWVVRAYTTEVAKAALDNDRGGPAPR